MIFVDVPALLERIGAGGAERRGLEWWARCPFPDHAEKTASFQMRDEPSSPKHGWFSCHGCGRAGGPVGLASMLLDLDRQAARAWLVEGGAATREIPTFAREMEGTRYYGPAFVLPEGVQFGPLEDWPSALREYAIARGLTPEQIERWGIGYATEGRLAWRIVIVKRDASGRARAFSARAISQRAKSRYLEPKNEDGPDFGCMFGEQHWPPLAERAHLDVVVLEGAFNGLAVERCVAAPFAVLSGSEVSAIHAAKLATFRRLIVGTDGDAAGERAFEKILKRLARAETARARFPRKCDANDLERSDPEELRRVLGWG